MRDSTPSPPHAAAAEGVIQFGYAMRAPAANDRIDPALHHALEACRRKLKHAGLVGRDPHRYDGFAFGNLSARDPHDARRFFISASQVTDADSLAPCHWPRVDTFDEDRFFAQVTGDHPPSSESVTHAVIYAAAPEIGCVLHVHSPGIWHNGATLGLAATGKDTPYGSRQLAREVEALLAQRTGAGLVFTTPGHEDGVFVCGRDIAAAAEALLSLHRRAERIPT